MAYPTYSVSTDTASGSVNLAALHEQVASDPGSPASFLGFSCSGDTITTHCSSEPTAGEKSTIDGIVAVHVGSTEPVPEYYAIERSNGATGRIVKETWYSQTDGSGSYSVPSSDIVYTYQGNSLVNRVETEYWSDGTVRETKTIGYFLAGSMIVEKEI